MVPSAPRPSYARLLTRASWCPAALLLMGLNCDKGPDTEWVQFNGTDDHAELAVTAATEVGETMVVDLTSTTGNTVIGSLTIDPGSGPVGTSHSLTVEVFDDWEDTVTRVTMSLDSGVRGAAEFDMEQDSADPGYWVLDLTSYGVQDEERTDAITIRLWELVAITDTVELPDVE